LSYDPAALENQADDRCEKTLCTCGKSFENDAHDDIFVSTKNDTKRTVDEPEMEKLHKGQTRGFNLSDLVDED